MKSSQRLFSGAAAVAVVMLSVGTAGEADADLFVYPARGQGAQQEDRDKYECHEWSRNQTGIDPVQLALQDQQALESTADGDDHGLVDDGAKGAARGALRGTIAGDVAKDAAMGASISPMVALLRHRRKIERRHAAWQKQITSEKAAMARYDQGYATCLRGRGYTVSGE
ncbi:MAG: hypothetical protein U9R74_08870 [Pseudomonadota bacterium]|nr:hypothetical protein [Pseudomonadota bacterium]